MCLVDLQIFLVFLFEHSFDILDNYIEEYIQSFIYEIIDWKDLLIHDLAIDLCDSNNYIGIVKASVTEIREENESLVEPLFEFILSELFKENWVMTIIDNIYTMEKTKKCSYDIPEEIYLRYLNEYVGNLWIKSLIEAGIDEIRGGDELKLKKLMPI